MEWWEPPPDICSGKDLAEEFFNWNERYHPLKSRWELAEKQKNKNDEAYPYEAWKNMAKTKLVELVNSLLDRKKNEILEAAASRLEAVDDYL